jgi:hypothetical protein
LFGGNLTITVVRARGRPWEAVLSEANEEVVTLGEAIRLLQQIEDGEPVASQRLARLLRDPDNPSLITGVVGLETE